MVTDSLDGEVKPTFVSVLAVRLFIASWRLAIAEQEAHREPWQTFT